MGKDWLQIRSGPLKRDLKHVQGTIRGYTEKSVQPRLFQAMQRLMSIAADQGRTAITYRFQTETGRARKAAGEGSASRVVSGAMRDAFGWDQKKTGKNTYVFHVGWVAKNADGVGYSVFQEHGTKTGIEGMHIIDEVTEFVRQEAHNLRLGKGAVRTESTNKSFTEE